jgi:hypothetical protein
MLQVWAVEGGVEASGEVVDGQETVVGEVIELLRPTRGRHYGRGEGGISEEIDVEVEGVCHLGRCW